MDALHRLHAERATGRVGFRFGPGGVERLTEAGSAKLRIPVKSNEAMLINTSGGLAGGDHVMIDATAAADLVLTSQAAERVYKTLGPPAIVRVSLRADDGASLAWLPHETILFDGAALDRRLDVSLSRDAAFTACEAVVLGRTESGETVGQSRFRDCWQIRREGVLAHADTTRFEGAPPASAATLAGAKAFATLLHVAPDAEACVDRLRGAVGKHGGVSAWSGKLVARLLAEDGFALRKVLKQALLALRGPEGLPKTWAM